MKMFVLEIVSRKSKRQSSRDFSANHFLVKVFSVENMLSLTLMVSFQNPRFQWCWYSRCGDEPKGRIGKPLQRFFLNFGGTPFHQ